jgi:anti-sigma B factor antagonist
MTALAGLADPDRTGDCMDIAVEDLAGGIAKVVLRGRFDTTGAVVIELPFNKIVTEKRGVIVDLSAVNFLSSYALRVLLVGAKIVNGKGGRLVILCPDNNVAKVLKTAGTDALIPIFQSESAAAAALTSS